MSTASQQEFHGAQHADALIDLTGASVLGSHFRACSLELRESNESVMHGRNLMVDCSYIGAGWPEYVRQTSAWRASA